MKKTNETSVKRIIALLLCAIFVMATLAGCGGSGSKEAEKTEEPAAEAPAEEAAEEPSEGSGEGVSCIMATGGQDTLPSYATTLDVIDDIQANSDITIDYKGARQLGEDAEILQQVMAGTIQMGGTAASAFSTYTNLLDAFVAPFVLNDYEKEEAAMKTDEAQAIYDAIEEQIGIKILACYDSGMRYLANNTKPIATLEDMKGLKLRVAPTDLLIDSFSAMGANPSNLAYGDLYTGLQNGTIDGEEINITSIYSEKHYEVLKYFTDIGIYPFSTTIFANAEWFNSLSEEDQKILQDSFTEGYTYLFETHIPEAEEAGLKAMDEAGIEITHIEDPTPFQDAVADVVASCKDKDPLIKAFIDMAEQQ